MVLEFRYRYDGCRGINDVPVSLKGPDQTVAKTPDRRLSRTGNGISRGGGTDEAAQKPDFVVTTNNDALFEPACYLAGGV